MIPYGEIIVLTTPAGKRYIRKLEQGADWQSANGVIRAAQIADSDFGNIVHTSTGMPVRIGEAGLIDILMGLKRKTQIIYPKEIAWICLKLGVGPGKKIVEAGCGSGSLTTALSWFCGAQGRVISHDAREEFARLTRRNLDWAGLGANVELHIRDIADGFAATGADALFLDTREPWLYLDHIPAAVKQGAMLGFLLPTAPQVSQLLAALERGAFGEIEVTEIMMRNWKPLPDRLRPNDRMVAHTGFLVFCRLQPTSREFDEYINPGTRERKQEAARAARLADSDDQLPPL